MTAKEVRGKLRQIYDSRAKRCGYDSWGTFIKELHLENEDAADAAGVLKDMIDHDQSHCDTIGRSES